MSDRAIAYEREDGVVVIRASAIGQCSRALWAALSGIEPVAVPANVERIFAEGHLHEEAVRRTIEESGIGITAGQEEAVLWVIPNKLAIIGHVDGIVEYDGRRIWENKALGKATFARWQSSGFAAFESYAWQISVYMHALGLGAYYTVKRRDDGLMDERTFDEPPIRLDAIRSKALGVYRAWIQDEMPACDPERWGCDYYFLHDEQEVPEDETSPPLLAGHEEKLDVMAAEWDELSAYEKEIKNRKAELKAEMDLIRDGRRRFTTTQWTFDIQQKTRTTLDRARLQADLGDKYDDYVNTSTFDAWVIRERKGP